MNIKTGDIVIDPLTKWRYYVTRICFENADVSDKCKVTDCLSEHGTVYTATLDRIKNIFEPTGDRVPFEDIAAILFPKGEEK